MVSKVNMDKQDAMVEILHPHRPQKNFKWPRNSDRCLVTVQSILGIFRLLLEMLNLEILVAESNRNSQLLS